MSVRVAVQDLQRLDDVEVHLLEPGQERLALQRAEPGPGQRADRVDQLPQQRRGLPG